MLTDIQIISAFYSLMQNFNNIVNRSDCHLTLRVDHYEISQILMHLGIFISYINIKFYNEEIGSKITFRIERRLWRLV